MSLKFASAVLVAAAAVVSSPAFACMGPTVLYTDNFQQPNSNWAGPPGTLVIGGGYAQVTPPQGDWSIAGYTGSSFDSADMCVDVLSPTTTDQGSAVGGLVFGLNATASAIDYYSLQIEEDGYATVALWQNNAWTNPVSWRAAPTVKTGPNATNTLRVTWKGSSATGYINGQLFGTFNIQALSSSLIGVFAQGDASPTAGATWKFTNLKITNVP